MLTPEDLPIGFSERELLIEENNALLEKIYKLEYENEVLKDKLRKEARSEDDWK